jgi:hypothetical protein
MKGRERAYAGMPTKNKLRKLFWLISQHQQRYLYQTMHVITTMTSCVLNGPQYG